MNEYNEKVGVSVEPKLYTINQIISTVSTLTQQAKHQRESLCEINKRLMGEACRNQSDTPQRPENCGTLEHLEDALRDLGESLEEIGYEITRLKGI